MPFGSWRYFKSKKQADNYKNLAQKKGYFVSSPEKINKEWAISILTKKGKNPFFIKGI